MKKLAFILVILVIAFGAKAQHSIAGTWTCGPAGDQNFQKETIVLTADGLFYGLQEYPQYEFYHQDPNVFLGIYTFDGKTLTLIDLKSDTRSSYQIQTLGSGGFTMYQKESGLTWRYTYQGQGVLNNSQKTQLLSWENYRKLGGAWRSDTETLKFIPSQGLIIIRRHDDANYFNWGTYTINGNELIVNNIDAEQAVFYRGTLSEFTKKQIKLTHNAGGSDVYKFQGDLNLDETEVYMVKEYMSMMHRITMSIIDLMDGQQDYIWKRVDKYGNIID